MFQMDSPFSCGHFEMRLTQKSNKKSNPTFPTLSDFFRLLDFFRLSDSTALTQIMKAEGREEFVPGNSRWPGAQEWLVGSIQRGSSSRVRTEQKVELSLSLGPLVLPFLVIHQSSSLVSLILLAPSGALVFIMVYYIPSSAAALVVITFSKADAEQLRLIKRELRLTSDYCKSD